MNAALLLVAAVLVGQTDPPALPPKSALPPALAKPPMPEEAAPFTLDQIAVGARNDAFVDEFLKDKSLKIFGQVQRIERVPPSVPPPVQPLEGQDPAKPAAKPPANSQVTYLLVMERVGHEDRAIDMEVLLQFDASARKDLALLEPGVSKVTIEGTCVVTQLQSLDKGVGFAMMLKDCKLIATPAGFEIGPRLPKTSVLPIITPPTAPGPLPLPNLPQP